MKCLLRNMAAALVLAAFLLAPALAAANTITFDYTTGIKDTFVYSGRPGQRVGHRQRSFILKYYRRHHRLSEAQALISFDDIIGNNPGEIPLGSTITEASLRLYMYSAGSGHRLQIHEMNTAWNENSTWNSLGGGAHPGSSPLSTFRVARRGAFYNINVTPSLQAWANGTRPNFGWVLTEPSIRRGLVGMATSEYRNLRLRPVLTVKYTAATPEPGTLFTLMGGLGVMGWWRRRRAQAAA